MDDEDYSSDAVSALSDEDNVNDRRDRQYDDAIASIRKNDPSLNDFSIDIHSHQHEVSSQLSEALKVNTHLKKLRLFCYLPCNDDDYAEYKYLASGIQNANLTHLYLGGDVSYFPEDTFSLHGGYVPHIANPFIIAARRSLTIQHLEVFTVAEGIGEIATCMSHIQILHLGGEFLTGDLKLLCDGLQRTSTLTTLYLCDDILKSANDFRRFSQALANNTSLTSLHIVNNDMNNDGVKAFLEHWHRDSQIHTLALTRTKITAEGAVLLLQAASSHTAMESLNISENLGIGYEGLANIAMELPNIVLKSLNVAQCIVPRHKWIDAKWRETAVVVANLIAQGVKANTHLVDIDISDNIFDVASGEAVDEALAFYTLRNEYNSFMVSDSQLPASVWCVCFAEHSEDASFIFHFLREQPALWPVCCSRENKRQRIG